MTFTEFWGSSGGSLGGLQGTSLGPGVLGRAPGRPWGEAGPLKGCWGAQASPGDTTVATSRWPFVPPQLETPEPPRGALVTPTVKKCPPKLLCV